MNMQPFSIKKQRGLTLVELMIALLLGVVLTSGIIRTFTANKQTFNTMEGMARLQEGARFTLDTLTRDIRMIGYMGCMSINMPVHNTLYAKYQGEYDISAGAAGYEAGATDWTPALPATLTGLANPPTAGTDIIKIFGMSSEGERLAASMPNSSADLKVVTPTSLKDNDIVFLSDCQKGAIFQATQVNSNSSSGKDNVVHNTGSSWNETKPLTTDGSSFGEDATVYKLVTKYYYIAPGTGLNNDGDPVQSLYVMENNVVSELIEGVEDLQIMYGVDVSPTDSNLMANRYVTANNIGANDEVVSIRLQVTTNSINHASNQGDGLLRRTFTQSVKIRNRGAF